MFELRRTTPIGSDECAGYEVILDKPCTVKEFIDMALKEKDNEWGQFHIVKPHILASYPLPSNIAATAEYSSGKLKTENTIPEKYLSKTISKITASGGWSRMDYYIKVKNFS